MRNQWDWHVRPQCERLARWWRARQIPTRISGKGNHIQAGRSTGASRIEVRGDSNHVELSPDLLLGTLHLFIRGDGNRIVIGGGRIDSLEVHVNGDKCELVIGSPTYVSNACLILAESQTDIQIGEYSMLATGIEIRTGDAHGIFDYHTRERVNHGASVRIGRHVWLANRVNVMKGSDIADDVIVGSGSMVAGPLAESHAIYAGVPARLVRSGVTWNWSLNEFPRCLDKL